MFDHLCDIPPKDQKHRDQRACVHHDLEYQRLGLCAQKRARDHQMARTGYRKEFRYPLHKAQDHCLPNGHANPPYRFIT